MLGQSKYKSVHLAVSVGFNPTAKLPVMSVDSVLDDVVPYNYCGSTILLKEQ